MYYCSAEYYKHYKYFISSIVVIPTYSFWVDVDNAFESEDSSSSFCRIITLGISFDVREQHGKDLFDAQRSDGHHGYYLIAGAAGARLQFLT